MDSPAIPGLGPNIRLWMADGGKNVTAGPDLEALLWFGWNLWRFSGLNGKTDVGAWNTGGVMELWPLIADSRIHGYNKMVL